MDADCRDSGSPESRKTFENINIIRVWVQGLVGLGKGVGMAQKDQVVKFFQFYSGLVCKTACGFFQAVATEEVKNFLVKHGFSILDSVVSERMLSSGNGWQISSEG